MLLLLVLPLLLLLLSLLDQVSCCCARPTMLAISRCCALNAWRIYLPVVLRCLSVNDRY